MTYYQGNALYEMIERQKRTDFVYSVHNSWQLVYGDKNGTPILILFVKSVNSLNNSFSKTDKDSIRLLKHAADTGNLPFMTLLFDGNKKEINNVVINGEKISLISLANLFRNLGLPIQTNNTTQKAINDKPSSAYHNWQRMNLGNSLIVSDIDLWKVTKEGKPIRIYELKRSYIPLDKWTPFKADYNNFRLISNFCNLTNISFKIVYNRREKYPVFHDDISLLKVFDVNFSRSNPILLEGVYTLDKFWDL